MKEEKKSAEPAKKIDMSSAEEVKVKIEMQLKKLNELNTMFAHREKFMQTQDDLNKFLSAIKTGMKENEFEQSSHRISFFDNFSRHSDSIFSITNPYLLIEFIEMLQTKTALKLDELNTGIILLSNAA